MLCEVTRRRNYVEQSLQIRPSKPNYVKITINGLNKQCHNTTKKQQTQRHHSAWMVLPHTAYEHAIQH